MSDLLGALEEAALAISSVALLIGLLSLARVKRSPAPVAWWIGVAMVSALVRGLAEIDERLLKIPIVRLGLAWMAVGW